MANLDSEDSQVFESLNFSHSYLKSFALRLTIIVTTTCIMAESACQSGIWAVITENKANKTALESIMAPPWVSAAEFRGTMAILQTCILTLVACIYTALHLNVPKDAGWRSVLWAKTKWAILTLLAPELVLFAAGRQYYEASRLKSELKHLQLSSSTVDKSVNQSMI